MAPSLTDKQDREQRELESQIKVLQKCVAAKDPSATIIAMLETLKKDFTPTEDMLRNTKAGVMVGKLRQNADKEIARHANEVVSKWRKLVEAEKAARLRKKAGGSPASSSAAAMSSSSATLPLVGSTASPSSSSSAAHQKPFKGDPEKRRADTDGVDTRGRTDSDARDACVKLMYNGLSYRSSEPVELVLARAVEVEAAAYSLFRGEGKDYKDKMRSLFQNLKNKTNKELGRRVMRGEVTAARFVRMTHDELKSAEQKETDSKLERENMKKAQVPMMEKSISDALRCGKCGQKKVSYSQAQTRSADEPMTTFCECTVCGNRWKFS